MVRLILVVLVSEAGNMCSDLAAGHEGVTDWWACRPACLDLKLTTEVYTCCCGS
jgi:hypothetical protein